MPVPQRVNLLVGWISSNYCGVGILPAPFLRTGKMPVPQKKRVNFLMGFSEKKNKPQSSFRGLSL
jgi:hypothetical protein